MLLGDAYLSCHFKQQEIMNAHNSRLLSRSHCPLLLHAPFITNVGGKVTLSQWKITGFRVNVVIIQTCLRTMWRCHDCQFQSSLEFCYISMGLCLNPNKEETFFQILMLVSCLPSVSPCLRCSPWIKWMPFRTSTAPSRQMWRTTCWSAALSSSPPSVPPSKNILASDTERKCSQKSFSNQIFHFCAICSCCFRYAACEFWNKYKLVELLWWSWIFVLIRAHKVQHWNVMVWEWP